MGNVMRKLKKDIVLPIMALTTIALIISCGGKPNEKLKIDGKKYTISLGEIQYDEDAGVVSIAVLADGKPLQNITTHKQSSISIGGQQVSSSISSTQPVSVLLQFNGEIYPVDEVWSSEDGIFSCAMDGIPEKIAVKSGTSVGEGVYFNGKTKEYVSADTFYIGSRLKKRW